jgi:hypothetical protein
VAYGSADALEAAATAFETVKSQTGARQVNSSVMLKASADVTLSMEGVSLRGNYFETAYGYLVDASKHF